MKPKSGHYRFAGSVLICCQRRASGSKSAQSADTTTAELGHYPLRPSLDTFARKLHFDWLIEGIK